MITAYQVPYSQSSGNGLVTPVVDRRLYEFLLMNSVGVADGIQINTSGTSLIVTTGWGVIKGCVFGVTAETIEASAPASGSTNGRLLIQLDATNGTIQFMTQQASTLPALTQEDINGSGSIYQMELATYSITPTDISNLTVTYDTLESAQGVLNQVTSMLEPITTKLATIETGAQKNTVTSVAGKTGAVTLAKSDVGLGKVVNKELTMSLSGDVLTITYE
ncbi:MAG: hypothetical protein IJ091_11315 [Oscillospiraceae bacterium]|nr:hypothetical protein [Oscillospiraceae bacterium]MBQ8996388.1 hypothetical protein [Oscillospiraceae bacterium]